MGLRYTYFDENHRKIGIITEDTTIEEIQHLMVVYDLNEIRIKEE